jgi:hypothetical protein
MQKPEVFHYCVNEEFFYAKNVSTKNVPAEKDSGEEYSDKYLYQPKNDPKNNLSESISCHRRKCP